LGRCVFRLHEGAVCAPQIVPFLPARRTRVGVGLALRLRPADYDAPSRPFRSRIRPAIRGVVEERVRARPWIFLATDRRPLA